MEKVIEVGEYVINKIRETYDDTAIIAGGWARDQLYDNEIKDVDVWMTTVIPKRELLNLFPNLKRWKRFNRGIDERLQMVTKFEIKGICIDLVNIYPEFIPEGGTVCDTFDFGICQAWSIGDGVINGTDLFWEDFNKEVITYNKTEYNDKNLKRIKETHLPRLMLKFPKTKVRGLPGEVPPPPKLGGVKPEREVALPRNPEY